MRAQPEVRAHLADAVLGAINAAEDPLKNALGRVQRSVQLGVSLPDAVRTLPSCTTKTNCACSPSA
jgi:Flp pilus assembly protein TadB